MRFKGAYYLATMKLANLQIQIDLGCDPEVLRFFPEHLIETEVLNLELIIWEADEEWWRNCAAKSSVELRSKMRNQDPNLH